tara:strand:+ start:2226 stop:2513 length:288 start_codon:yes stop_codon:yes gene_type:complete
MIELNPTAESRMSAVKCMEGLRDKIEMFMKAGDITEHTTRGRSTKEETRLAREKALKIWRETNCTISQASRLSGADRGSFYKWLVENKYHTPTSR